MIIKFQYNAKTENGNLETRWILFQSKNKNYTKAVVDYIRKYLTENINPKFANVNDEAIKGWYTGKYDDSELTYDEKWNLYELRTANSFQSVQADKVKFVQIN